MLEERKQTILSGKLKDINPYYFGIATYYEAPKHTVIRRNCHFISYIEKGGCTLVKNGVKYTVGEGEAYMIAPGDEADCAYTTIPTTYIYFAFDGDLSYDFSSLPTVFKANKSYFLDILEADNTEEKEIYAAAAIMKLHTYLFKKHPQCTTDAVEMTKTYIDNNYMLPLKVSELANMMYLDRSYLTKIFKKRLGMSVNEYLISVRLKNAKSFLNEGKSVTETAILCGFNDHSHFSKTYKKHCNSVPKSQIGVNKGKG